MSNRWRPTGFSLLPLVIKNLLIINGLVFLAQNTFESRLGGTLVKWFALHYWGSELFKPHQLVTHLFMHGSLGHLFMNMFTLWMFGSVLENRIGPKRFLIFYMVCGIGAALCHLGVLTYENMMLNEDIHKFAFDPSYTNFVALSKRYDLNSVAYNIGPLKDALLYRPDDPKVITNVNLLLQEFQRTYQNTATLGASGAVFGLLFAFGYLFPNNIIYIYFFFPLRAKYFVGILILLELISGVRNSAGDNVAHFAHLGGVLFSYLLLRMWKQRQQNLFL